MYADSWDCVDIWGNWGSGGRVGRRLIGRSVVCLGSGCMTKCPGENTLNPKLLPTWWVNVWTAIYRRAPWMESTVVRVGTLQCSISVRICKYGMFSAAFINASLFTVRIHYTNHAWCKVIGASWSFVHGLFYWRCVYLRKKNQKQYKLNNYSVFQDSVNHWLNVKLPDLQAHGSSVGWHWRWVSMGRGM